MKTFDLMKLTLLLVFGLVVFASCDDDDDDTPRAVPTEVQAFINANYAGAMIVDFDREYGGYEVDIYHDGKSIEIWFDTAYNWLMTKTDLTRSVPDIVRDAVNTNYPGKRIDDCDYVETAQGETYYLVDLDNYYMDLKITLDGQITEIPD